MINKKQMKQSLFLFNDKFSFPPFTEGIEPESVASRTNTFILQIHDYLCGGCKTL